MRREMASEEPMIVPEIDRIILIDRSTYLGKLHWFRHPHCFHLESATW